MLSDILILGPPHSVPQSVVQGLFGKYVMNNGWVLSQDDMRRHAAFHQSLHCLLRQKQSSEKEIYFCFGNHNL